MGSYRLAVTRSWRNGQSMWLLRWWERGVLSRQTRGVTKGDVLRSHWFADEQEARTVLTAMRAGESFEVAFRRVWEHTRHE